MYSKDFDNNKVTKKAVFGGAGAGAGLTALAAILAKKKIPLSSALKGSIVGAGIGSGTGLVTGNSVDYVRGLINMGSQNPVKRLLDTLKTPAIKDAHDHGSLNSKGTGAIGAGVALSTYNKALGRLREMSPRIAAKAGTKAKLAVILAGAGFAGGTAIGYGTGATVGGLNNLATKSLFKPKKKED
jgi:hypothetical protein